MNGMTTYNFGSGLTDIEATSVRSDYIVTDDINSISGQLNLNNNNLVNVNLIDGYSLSTFNDKIIYSSNTTTWTSNNLAYSSNTASWSSNNLLNRNGGTMWGYLAMSDNTIFMRGNTDYNHILKHYALNGMDGPFIGGADSVAIGRGNSGNPVLDMVVKFGNVGINTSNPVYKLDVNGSASFSSIYIPSQYQTGCNHRLYENNSGYLSLDNWGVSTVLSIQGKNVLSAFNSGKVGIGDFNPGTITPGAMLSTYSLSNAYDNGFHNMAETAIPSSISIGFRQNGFIYPDTIANTDAAGIGYKTISLTSLSNSCDLVFRRAFGNYYTTRTADIMKMSYSNCEVNINSNLCIGTTSNQQVKLSLSGAAGNINGAHINHYVTGSPYPIFQTLCWGERNVAHNFSSYYDGGGWKSSSTTGNCYNIYNFGDELQVNYGSAPVGSNLSWNKCVAFSSNTLQTGILNARGSGFIDSAASTNIIGKGIYGDSNTRVVFRPAQDVNSYPYQISVGIGSLNFGTRGYAHAHQFWSSNVKQVKFDLMDDMTPIATMYGLTDTKTLRVGNGIIKRYEYIEDINIGVSSTQFKTWTYTLPVEITTNYAVFFSHYQATYSDTFVSKVQNKTSLWYDP